MKGLAFTGVIIRLPLLVKADFHLKAAVPSIIFHLGGDKLRIKLACFPLETPHLARVVALHASQIGAAARRFHTDFFQGE